MRSYCKLSRQTRSNGSRISTKLRYHLTFSFKLDIPIRKVVQLVSKLKYLPQKASTIDLKEQFAIILKIAGFRGVFAT